jgi:Ca2+-binding RTX toxin-like protein
LGEFVGSDSTDLLLGDVSIDDTISGGAGSDTIYGDGSDVVNGSIGDNGFLGADFIFGNQGTDLIYGGAGNDTIYAGQNDAPEDASGSFRNGIDTVYAGDGHDFVFGNHGSDLLYGGGSSDTMFGGQDDDTIFGGTNSDLIYGNLGNDVLEGGDPDSTSKLTSFTDTLIGGSGNDTMYGGDGTGSLNEYYVADGDDVIYEFYRFGTQDGGDRFAISTSTTYTYTWANQSDSSSSEYGDYTIAYSNGSSLVIKDQLGPDANLTVNGVATSPETPDDWVFFL